MKTFFDNKKRERLFTRENRLALKEIMTYVKKIYELKETFMRKQDKNTFFEADLTRSR